MSNKESNGFSLIELIVVMTIIAVITVIGTVGFSGSGQKARDSRRIADLEKLRMALEIARQVGGTYPTTLTALSPAYIQNLPKDPKGGDTYPYTRGATPYSYNLYGCMENLGSTNVGGIATTCPGSINYNYLITNP
jgi:general secretion pathway protein G